MKCNEEKAILGVISMLTKNISLIGVGTVTQQPSSFSFKIF